MNVTIINDNTKTVNCNSGNDGKRVIEYLTNRMIDNYNLYLNGPMARFVEQHKSGIWDENTYHLIKSNLDSLQSEFDETMKIANLINFGGCSTLSRIKRLLGELYELIKKVEKRRILRQNTVENVRRKQSWFEYWFGRK